MIHTIVFRGTERRNTRQSAHAQAYITVDHRKVPIRVPKDSGVVFGVMLRQSHDTVITHVNDLTLKVRTHLNWSRRLNGKGPGPQGKNIPPVVANRILTDVLRDNRLPKAKVSELRTLLGQRR
jgi:hypothetical protein